MLYSCITISLNFVQLYHSTWKSKALQSRSSSLACYGADLFFCDFANKWDIMCHTPQKIVDTCTTNALASLLGNIPAHQQRFWIRLAMPYNQAPLNEFSPQLDQFLAIVKVAQPLCIVSSFFFSMLALCLRCPKQSQEWTPHDYIF